MPKEVDLFYDQSYEEEMGTGLIGIFWRFIHRQLSRIVASTDNSIIFEIGAGHGQHFDSAFHKSRLYIETDIRQSFGYLKTFSDKDLNLSGRIKRVMNAEALILVPNNSVDRVVVTCVLAHLRNPDTALIEWRRIVKPDGRLVIYIPCEPGLFLRFSRYFTTRKKLNSLGVNQDAIHWLEHRNHFPYLQLLIKQAFRNDNVQVKRFPFACLPWDLNLYAIISIDKSDFN